MNNYIKFNWPKHSNSKTEMGTVDKKSKWSNYIWYMCSMWSEKNQFQKVTDCMIQFMYYSWMTEL